MIGIADPVLGKEQGNSFSRATFQPESSLVEDHAKFVENTVRRAIFVHKLVRSTVHLKGNREFVDLPHRLVVSALVDSDVATTTTDTTRLLVVVDICDHVVEIAPTIVVAVTITITSTTKVHQGRHPWFTNKGVPIENAESPFLVKSFDIDVGHDVIALGLRDRQPRLNRPCHAGIVNAGAPFPKGTVVVVVVIAVGVPWANSRDQIQNTEDL